MRLVSIKVTKSDGTTLLLWYDADEDVKKRKFMMDFQGIKPKKLNDKE